jgi:hypothetical protein
MILFPSRVFVAAFLSAVSIVAPLTAIAPSAGNQNGGK